jgi:hypothetical protein
MSAPFVLSAFEAKHLAKGLKDLAYLGSAIHSIAEVMEIAQIITGCSPCVECADIHDRLTGAHTQGGLITALAELGMIVASNAEGLEERYLSTTTNREEQP